MQANAGVAAAFTARAAVLLSGQYSPISHNVTITCHNILTSGSAWPSSILYVGDIITVQTCDEQALGVGKASKQDGP